MAEWKKLVTSGSNVSQLFNDAGYLTSATITAKNAFATASFNGTVLIADSPSGSLNFASSSGQGLTISASAGNDTLTFGLAAIPTSSLLNSGSIIGTTPVNLGATVTSIAGLTLTNAVVSGSLFGTASYASQALSASFASTATSASQATTASYALSATSSSFASNATSASYALTATSASFASTATSASQATTASYALTTTSASFATNATSASFATTASFAKSAILNISASTGLSSVDLGTQTLAFQGTANQVDVTSMGQTLYFGLPNNVTIAGDLAVNGGDITTLSTTASLFNSTATQVNIGGSALQMRIGNAAGTVTIPGNLTVQGTTTTVSSSVLEIADQFILLASGSNTDVDGGLIIQNAANGSGHAFGYGTPENRWVLQSSLNSLSSSFSSIDGYVNTTQYGLLSALPANPSYGGSSYGYGNMYTTTDTDEIFVWA